MEIKTTMKYHPKPVMIAIIEKTINNNQLRWISSDNIIYNMVTIVDNTV